MPDEPNHKYDLFISYNRADEEWARRLATRVEQEQWQGRSLRAFFAPWDIRPGESVNERLNRALAESRYFGLVLSPESVASQWVGEEWFSSHHADVERKERRLIPLHLRDCDIPRFIAHLNHIDFRDPDKFEEGFRLLLTVLREEPLPRGDGQDEPAEVSLPPSVPRPPAGSFVARYDREGRNLLELLRQELSPHKNQLVVLWGDGGVGKTTLAYEALRAAVGDFGGRIVWASPELRANLTFVTLLDEIATQLGRPEIRQLAAAPKEERVLQLVAESPAVVVLDNFETVKRREQRLCLDFLAGRARCPALITTRKRITHRGVSNIAVEVMKPDEAREFIAGWVSREAANPHVFDEIDRDRIINAADRNPLVMQWVVAQIDRARDPDAVLSDLSRGRGDAASRVFGNTFKLLDEDARSALLALSLFTPSAPREALAEVAGLNNPESFDEAVGQLADYWLVKSEGQGKRLSIKGLTRDLAKARLAEHKLAVEFRRRFTAYFLSYTVERRERTPENYDALEEEKDNLLGAAEAAFNSEDWGSVMLMAYALANPIDGMLTVRGYWDEAVGLGEQALQAARSSKDERRVAELSHNIAVMYANRGEPAKARCLYDESLEIAKSLGDQGGVAITLHELGRLAQEQGELEEAHRLLDESLEIKKRLGNQSGLARTLHHLAILAHQQGELEEARRLFDESLKIKRSLGDELGVAITLHELGRLAHKQGGFEEARRRFGESLEIKNRLRNQSGIAVTLHQLGMLAAAEGDKEEAARLFSESLTILEKLGSSDAEIARRNLARVEGESS